MASCLIKLIEPFPLCFVQSKCWERVTAEPKYRDSGCHIFIPHERFFTQVIYFAFPSFPLLLPTFKSAVLRRMVCETLDGGKMRFIYFNTFFFVNVVSLIFQKTSFVIQSKVSENFDEENWFLCLKTSILRGKIWQHFHAHVTLFQKNTHRRN